MTILLIAFIAGILTVLAPCVLPLLPVIVGGSISSAAAQKPSKKKAVIVALSLGVSVILFTFLLKVSTLFINIPPEVWSWISGVIIVVLGLVTLFPQIWDKLKFVSKASKESNKMMGAGYKKDSIWGDIIIGASLGPVFSTCSPTYFFILATVLPLEPIAGFIDLLAYTVGLCLALLVIAFAGQKILEKLGVASDPKGWLKRTLGVIFILVGIAIFFGVDKTFEANLLSGGFFDITKVEQTLLQNVSSPGGNKLQIVPSASSDATSTSSVTSTDSSVAATQFQVQNQTQNQTNSSVKALPLSEKARVMMKSQLYPKAPEIVDPSGFVNTDGKPITIGQFKGKKVVLLDVWTYSCINCKRTLPYVKAWYDKYHDQGLEIIGLHTPEFSFEKVQKNVEDAVKADGIQYPVVLDNNYATWNAYGNQYWPRKYLIDTDGFIIYDHIGEGDYDVTEKAIQKALSERDQIVNATSTVSTAITAPKDVITFDQDKVASPETYFGAGRNEYLGNGTMSTVGNQTLTLPTSGISGNTLYLSGTWDFEKEYAQEVTLPASGSSMSGSTGTSILFKYSAMNVYMVASASTPTDVDVYIDGKMTKTVSISGETLYTLVQGADYGIHTLELKPHASGLKAFTFTFG
jgi:cytochrome c biogenesis protein CcdA/thiol-disulfide isomerase/thioredoxin